MTGIEAAKAKPYIYEPVDGFKLRGANNQGECYKLKKTLTTPVIDISKVKNSDGTPKFNPDLDMKDSKDQKYFNDPAITFEDSIVTGCHLDLNFAEL